MTLGGRPNQHRRQGVTSDEPRHNREDELRVGRVTRALRRWARRGPADGRFWEGHSFMVSQIAEGRLTVR